MMRDRGVPCPCCCCEKRCGEAIPRQCRCGVAPRSRSCPMTTKHKRSVGVNKITTTAKKIQNKHTTNNKPGSLDPRRCRCGVAPRSRSCPMKTKQKRSVGV